MKVKANVGKRRVDPAQTASATGSLAWGMVLDDFRPDRYGIAGAAICLAGVEVIMYAPRPV